MAGIAIQRRGGSTTAHANFTGLAREITVDTSNNTVKVHDGSTAGGFEAAGLHVQNTWKAGQAGTQHILTNAASVAIDFYFGNDFYLPIAGNLTLDNGINVKVGQSGSIWVEQDVNGSRTLSYASNWKFAGGTAPTLTTTANANDRIDYVTIGANSIHAVATLDIK